MAFNDDDVVYSELDWDYAADETDDRVRYVRVRPRRRNGWQRPGSSLDGGPTEPAYKPVLPDHII
jgi:hypothetical protein